MDNANLYSDTINIHSTTERVEFNYDYAKADDLRRDSNALSKVEIKLSCTDLPNTDETSKSDPRVIVYFQERKFQNNQVSTNWVKIDSTETVKDNLNPEYAKSFIFDYYFEYIQNLRFVVLDMNEDAVNLEDNDYLGYVEESINGIISAAKDNKCSFKLKGDIPVGTEFKKNSNAGTKGTLNIRIEILKDNNKYALMDISGRNLDKKDLLGKSDPYFIIYKKGLDNQWVKVYHSTVIMKTLNPDWTKIYIPLLQLNSGDDKRMLKWEVWDWDKDTPPDYIGGFEATFEEIQTKKEYELINDKKVKTKGSKCKNSGVLMFNRIIIRENQSFSSFTLGGTEFEVDFAIDFTQSNGEPQEKTSLHYINPNKDPLISIL